MDTEKPLVTLVGLGLIGASIGLGLRQAEAAERVTGHDPDRRAADQAKDVGAVDRTDWNLVSACEKADLVVLATPLGAIKPTLEALAPHLKPGCVVLDTASVKGPVLAWAAETLPAEVQFVGGNPIVGASLGGRWGTKAARADLFEGSLFCIVPPAAAEEQAIRLTSNLVSLLGAKPLFVDPVEHDGLLAGMEHLPAFLSLALLEMATGQPSWRELRKVAGPTFETGTHLAATSPDAHGDLFVANRENLLRWLDTFADTLSSLRQALEDDDPEALSERVAEALEARAEWMQDRAHGDWAEGVRPELPERPNLLEAVVGSFFGRRSRREP